MNRMEYVDGILEKLTGVNNFDEPLQLQILNEKHTSNGEDLEAFFILHESLYMINDVLFMRNLLTHFWLI